MRRKFARTALPTSPISPPVMLDDSASTFFYLIAIYVLYIAGMIVNRGSINYLHIFIFMVCAYLAVASAGGGFGYVRYREQFFVLLIIGLCANLKPLVDLILQKIADRYAPKLH